MVFDCLLARWVGVALITMSSCLQILAKTVIYSNYLSAQLTLAVQLQLPNCLPVPHWSDCATVNAATVAGVLALRS